ncbi:LacI family DNA-binding transcriptional regulator [Pseudalkalibacillus hwajinpoensis]|uniref:LacI family DNA-binding transcriptional regulator n=1 Tax=Guptibacillus hwajinpoensis TaxID=208199 RepID=UPI00325BEB63
MVTIKDIASRSNFSSATVSRVLNNDEKLSVSFETRRRILDVAKELGYKTLQERKGEQINPKEKGPKVGILLCQSVEEEMNDTYFLSIRRGVERECADLGFTATELFRLSNLSSEQISSDLENLIVIGRINTEILESFNTRLKNVVYINNIEADEGFDSVVIDFKNATRKAIQHLIDLGYKRLGYIGGMEAEHYSNNKIPIEDTRKKTFEMVMKEFGLYEEQNVMVGEFTMKSGYEQMNQHIKRGDVPEAFFVASDGLAIGAMRALQEANLKVPEDVAIVSFNDIEMAKFASTPLTTIKVYTEEMGRIGVKMMAERLNGRELPLKVTVPTKLVLRDSCGALGIKKATS